MGGAIFAEEIPRKNSFSITSYLSKRWEMKMDHKQQIYARYLSSCPDNLLKYRFSSFDQQFLMFEAYFGRLIPRNKKANILDLGCGSGAFVAWLQSKGYKSVEGIDISPEQIDAGKAHRVKNLRQQDVFAFLEAKEEVYDLISAHDLIEHFEKDRVLALLELIYKALKPGGNVLISTLNAESIFSARHRYSDFTHEVGFTPHSLSQVLYFTGFRDVKIFPKEPYVHGVKSAVRWVLWRSIKQLIRFYLLVEAGSVESGVYTETMYVIAHKKQKENL